MMMMIMMVMVMITFLTGRSEVPEEDPEGR